MGRKTVGHIFLSKREGVRPGVPGCGSCMRPSTAIVFHYVLVTHQMADRSQTSSVFLCKSGGLLVSKEICNVPLKAVDTVGSCQRLACTVGVSQHMHKITNL